MISIDPRVNPLHVLVLTSELEKSGIKDYSIRPGNGCVWVNYRSVDAYYIFNKSELVDVIFD